MDVEVVDTIYMNANRSGENRVFFLLTWRSH